MRQGTTSPPARANHPGLERLPAAILELSRLRDTAEVVQVIRREARELTGADGVAFVLREGDEVHYVDEDAVGPLWKGQRFPADACISGWAILHRETVVIEDVFADPRVPHELYRPTFVRSLAMVPVGAEAPIGALGAYWAHPHRPAAEEVRLLEALAASAAVAVANAWLAEELRRVEAARDELLENAAHELRTPLTPLRLQVDGLARAMERGEGPERLAHAVERLDENLGRLEQLVEGLERLPPATARAARTNDGPAVDLAAVARDVLARLAPALRESGSELALHAEAPVVGRWDRRRLDEVVGHLLSNAIRFGSGRPIEVRVEEEQGRARFSVRDGGIGVAAADRERIFRRFERAVSSREYGGLGLGLWQARRIVEAHGGLLHLESEPGRGSTFTVLLPR
jgi:signal transduction histidine kinase